MSIIFATADLIDTKALPQTQAESGDVAHILTLIFFVLGALAFLMVVIGGFRYVIAGGNPEDIKAARNTITYALAGIVVVVLAAVIVNFVINRI